MTDEPPVGPCGTTPSDLKRYLAGRMPDHLAAAVVAHVEECDACPVAMNEYAEALAEWDPQSAADFPAGPADRFAIVRPLTARGGMGELFVAYDRDARREVVYKRLRGGPVLSADAVARFRREFTLTGGLEHPGIPPVYAAGLDADHRPYYVMRYVKGTTLWHAIRAHAGGEAVSRDDLLRRFVAVCNTIGYAHEQGVIHRDIKPENVLVGTFDDTVVIDWGLAKRVADPDDPPAGPAAADPAADPLSQGVVGGTPGYMSPQQAAGERPSRADDIYALGATLYTILVGTPPPADAAIPSAVPPPLAAVCRTALRSDPAGRYASAVALARDVERWLAKEPVSVHPEPWLVRLRRRARRHRVPVAGAVVGTAVAVAALLVAVPVVHYERRQAQVYLDVARQNTAAFTRAIRGLRDGYQIDVTAAEAVYADAVQATDRLVTRTDGRPELLAEKARLATEYSGLIVRDVGDSRRGLPPAAEAVDLYARALAADPDRPDWRAGQAAALTVRADVYTLLGRTAAAAADRREAVRIATALADRHPVDPAARLALAQALEGMGDQLVDDGDHFAAEDWFRRSLALRSPGADDPAQAVIDLAKLEEKLAHCLSVSGDWAEQKAVLDRAGGRLDRLAAGRPALTRPHALARATVLLAQANALLDRSQNTYDPFDRDEFLSLVGRANGLCDRALAADPANADWQTIRARCDTYRRQYSRTAGTEDPRADVEALLRLADGRRTDDPSNLTRRIDAVTARTVLIHAWFTSAERLSESRVEADDIREAVRLADELRADFPAHFRAVRTVMSVHRLLATLARLRGPGDAAGHLRAARAAMEAWALPRLASDPRDPAAHARLAQLDGDAAFTRGLGKAADAVGGYRAALAHWDQVVSWRPDRSRWRQKQIEVCRQLATRSADRDRAAAMEEYRRRAAEWVEACPRDPRGWRTLAVYRMDVAETAARADVDAVVRSALDAKEEEFRLLPPAAAARSPFAGGWAVWDVRLLSDRTDSNEAPYWMQVMAQVASSLDVFASRSAVPDRRRLYLRDGGTYQAHRLCEDILKTVRATPWASPEARHLLADGLAVLDDLARRSGSRHPFHERLRKHLLAELHRRAASPTPLATAVTVALTLTAAERRLAAARRL